MKKSKIVAVSLSAFLVAGFGAGISAKNIRSSVVSPKLKIARAGKAASVSGLTPTQIKTAYGISKLSATGAGETIAIVDAYGSPNIQKDLNTFDTQFGLPATTVTVANPQGTPSTDGGWALETSLDVEWAHAIAPSAKILLVETKSASDADLLAGINYATSHGAQAVSLSWGGDEESNEASYDSYFNHSGVVYLAASGDDGYAASWPAASPYVLAVGGTTLKLTSAGAYYRETGWSGSGGGTSSYENEPTWQENYGLSDGGRDIPDVAFDADPSSGVAVYSSVSYEGSSGWWNVGGTSFSTPAWAGLVALADQAQGTHLSGPSDVLYTFAGGSKYSTYFHDITSGSNGVSATTGYDLVTGLGSPKANALVPVL